MYFRVECKIITKNTFKYSSVHNQLMFWSQFVSPHLVVTYTSKLDQYVNVRLKLGGLLLYLKIKCHTCEEKWPTYISLLDLNSVICSFTFAYFSMAHRPLPFLCIVKFIYSQDMYLAKFPPHQLLYLFLVLTLSLAFFLVQWPLHPSNVFQYVGDA